MEIDSQNRLIIPQELYEFSNLKGVDTVYIGIRGEDILFIPGESKEMPKDVKIYGVRKLDEKKRVILPQPFKKVSNEWEIYLLNGEILATWNIIE